MNDQSLGNPAALALASKVDPKIINDAVSDTQKAAKTAGKVILISAVGVGVFWGVNKIIDTLQENKNSDQYGDSPEIQQAIALRNAFNPSGLSWLIDVDTTNTTAAYLNAQKISNWSAVSKAYRELYNENLIDRLNKELDGSELEKYNAILNQNGLPDPTTGIEAPVTSVYTLSEAKLLTQGVLPDSLLSTAFNPNWIDTVPKGKQINRWSDSTMEKIWKDIEMEADKGYFVNSDEQKIYNWFKQTFSYYTVGYFFWYVQQKYGKWVLPSLSTFIKASEWLELYNTFKHKPLYK